MMEDWTLWANQKLRLEAFELRKNLFAYFVDKNFQKIKSIDKRQAHGVLLWLEWPYLSNADLNISVRSYIIY